jgi:hypothetical protein
MRFMLRCAVVIGFSVVVFLVMRLVFDGPHCLDRGARYGFPLSYMQDGTYGTHGRFFLIGSLVDFAIAMTVSPFAMWV